MAAKRRKIRGSGSRPRDPSKARRRRERAAVFGANVRRLRMKRGLSQEALGEEASVHRTHVSLVERGAVDPTLMTAVDLANALGVKLADLVEGID